MRFIGKKKKKIQEGKRRRTPTTQLRRNNGIQRHFTSYTKKQDPPSD
eukprot:CAMPEP_0171002584 /NCGR_PEP_ID=MMETSP0736-20130129/16302_1 /TAXON_ID=186038 /ORGANISM="Fragilariopsis kerguelensis, Strain L26-C5" /LENGTH=46 /DNA_ID= /DNA_START= /DNA_END= /DNA_ORIENTATION=